MMSYNLHSRTMLYVDTKLWQSKEKMHIVCKFLILLFYFETFKVCNICVNSLKLITYCIVCANIAHIRHQCQVGFKSTVSHRSY